MTDLYIGLMSGTSADGIDAALVDFSKPTPTLIATHYTPYTTDIRNKILALCMQGADEILRLGELDTLLGKEFAAAAAQLLKQQGLSPKVVKAIGSHGQTIRHMPAAPHHFTLQIGDPNIIAAETGVTTVADFRRRDLAHGGQGAPLVPAFHQYILASNKINRAIINIGGIANVTLLLKNNPAHIVGFDTGPGNVLMDAWIHKHKHQLHDKDGAWASSGAACAALLKHMLADKYFSQSAPKSTGREYFNLVWLEKQLANNPFSPVDVQTTLVELTAQTILEAIHHYMQDGEIIVCGGGAHNKFLMQRLKELAKPMYSISSTEQHGIHPDWVEAVAFAWLAKQTLSFKPGNLPSVTGAKNAAILGGVYYSSEN